MLFLLGSQEHWEYHNLKDSVRSWLKPQSLGTECLGSNLSSATYWHGQLPQPSHVSMKWQWKTPPRTVLGIIFANKGKAFKIVPGIKPYIFLSIKNFSQPWHIFQKLGIMCYFLSFTHTNILITSYLLGTVLGIQNKKWMNKSHNLCVELHISKCTCNNLLITIVFQSREQTEVII